MGSTFSTTVKTPIGIMDYNLRVMRNRNSTASDVFGSLSFARDNDAAAKLWELSDKATLQGLRDDTAFALRGVNPADGAKVAKMALRQVASVPKAVGAILP